MVKASLSFLKPLALYATDRPYFVSIPGNATSKAIIHTNAEFEPHEGVEIESVRDYAPQSFNIDKNGFEVVALDGKSPDLESKTQIETYLLSVTELVKSHCKACHVVCYDYRIRVNEHNLHSYESSEDLDRNKAAPPVFAVHIDHTIEGGPKRMRRHMTRSEADKYLSSEYRARIINLWRPLVGPVEDCPLALCDTRSIRVDDLVAADRVTPEFRVELYYMRHNQKQKWFWLPSQQTDEAWMFVTYDSQGSMKDLAWTACPHTAFLDPTARPGAPARASIEVRLMVFNEEEETR